MATKPKFFATPAKFREWLEKNHTSAKELEVGFHKKSSGKKSITYAEALDEALCFGWIDGVRHSIDETSYRMRFTPRRLGSIWSLINIKHVERLKKDGRMHAIRNEQVFILLKTRRRSCRLSMRRKFARRRARGNTFKRIRLI